MGEQWMGVGQAMGEKELGGGCLGNVQVSQNQHLLPFGPRVPGAIGMK